MSVRSAQGHAPEVEIGAPPPARAGSSRWDLISKVILAGAALVMALTIKDYGVTWDEYNHITYGDEVVRWYSSGFQDRAAITHRAYNLLGGLIDATSSLIANGAGWSIVFVRHALGALLAWLGLVYTYRLGRYLGGPRAGCFSLVALLVTPVYYGHAFNNPKDAPIAALFAIALFYIVSAIRFFPRIPWSLVARIGIAIGLALAIRVIAVSLVLYLGLAIGLFFLLDTVATGQTRVEHMKQQILAFAPRLLVIGALAYGIMLIFWPAAQLRPFDYVLTAIRRTQNYSWNLPVLFDGELLPARQLPRSYIVHWIVISLPEFYFLGAIAALVAAVSAFSAKLNAFPRSSWIAFGVLAFAICFPIAYQALRDSPVYDAWRHFLFIVPPLAMVGGCGLSWLLARSTAAWSLVKWPVVTLAGVSVVITVVDMIQLHPYQTIYFNRTVAGGVARAAGSYETDYWGSSYKEGAEWLEKNYYPDAPEGAVKVSSCSHPFLVTHYLRDKRFSHIGDPTEITDTANVALATTRWNCHQKIQGKLLYQVKRKGAPILYVREMKAPQ